MPMQAPGTSWWKVGVVLTLSAIVAARLRPRQSDAHPDIDERAPAMQSGRGRQADRPLAIPPRGWKDILLRTYKDFSQDRLSYVAGGVSFFILVALIPGLTAFISLYGLLAEPATVQNHLRLLEGLIPSDAFSLVGGEIERIAGQGALTLGVASIVSVGVALWSANAGTKALLDGLNVAYNEDEKRGFVRLTLVSFAFTLGAIAFLALGGTGIVVVPILLGVVGLGGTAEALISWLRWPILFLFVTVALAALFRYGPSRRAPKWRWVTIGSAVATGIWLAASALFSWYLANFADYSATYGSLGAVIGLMMWLWITMTLILAAAKFDAESEHQTARDSTVGREKPIGTRGAVVADTIGAKQD